MRTRPYAQCKNGTIGPAPLADRGDQPKRLRRGAAIDAGALCPLARYRVARGSITGSAVVGHLDRR
jgi:hypothetical protein